MEALGAKVEEDADGRVTGLDFRDVKLERKLRTVLSLMRIHILPSMLPMCMCACVHSFSLCV